MLSNRPWDVSAGVLIVREAGGSAYDYDGSPYTAHWRFTIASTPELVDPIGRLVRDALAEVGAPDAAAAQRAEATT